MIKMGEKIISKVKHKNYTIQVFLDNETNLFYSLIFDDLGVMLDVKFEAGSGIDAENKAKDYLEKVDNKKTMF